MKKNYFQKYILQAKLDGCVHKCGLCNNKYNSIANFTRHIKDVHNISRYTIYPGIQYFQVYNTFRYTIYPGIQYIQVHNKELGKSRIQKYLFYIKDLQ